MPTYFGETGRNAYSRGIEHVEKLSARDMDNSVLWLHSVHNHQCRADINYTIDVVNSYNEPVGRRLMERIKISYFNGEILMHRRTEMGEVREEPNTGKVCTRHENKPNSVIKHLIAVQRNWY